jgi:hypothetical protein
MFPPSAETISPLAAARHPVATSETPFENSGRLIFLFSHKGKSTLETVGPN